MKKTELLNHRTLMELRNLATSNSPVPVTALFSLITKASSRNKELLKKGMCPDATFHLWPGNSLGVNIDFEEGHCWMSAGGYTTDPLVGGVFLHYSKKSPKGVEDIRDFLKGLLLTVEWRWNKFKKPPPFVLRELDELGVTIDWEEQNDCT